MNLIESIPITSASVVVDIGANGGQEIELFLPTNCQIHSFEPHPMFFKELDEKYGAMPNLYLNQSAAWKEESKKTFYFKKGVSARNGGASLIKEKTNISLNLNTVVKCIDIAKYINNLNSKIDLLKIDAEGAEYEILNHLFETSTYQKIDHIYYEDHSRKIHESKWCKLRDEVLLKYKENNIVLNNWHLT